MTIFKLKEDLAPTTRENIGFEKWGPIVDVEITLQVESWYQRTFTAKDASERVEEDMDPTGW